MAKDKHLRMMLDEETKKFLERKVLIRASQYLLEVDHHAYIHAHHCTAPSLGGPKLSLALSEEKRDTQWWHMLGANY